MKQFTIGVIAFALAWAPLGCDVLESMILRPSPNIRSTPADFGYHADEKTLLLEDGREISIWHCKSAVEPRKGIIVVVPGNDANKGRYTSGLPVPRDGERLAGRGAEPRSDSE